MTTLRPILLLSFLYLNMGGSAQVFIPDQVERDWLNTEIPGIVDGNGIMDTLHPGIAQLDTTLIFIGVAPIDIVLRSIGHLHSLVKFSAATDPGPVNTDPIEFAILEVPSSLRTMVIQLMTNGISTVSLPALPPLMDRIDVFTILAPGSSLTIDTLPETLDRFNVSGIANMIWNGECHAARMEITEVGTQMVPWSTTVPPITTDILSLNSIYIADLVLSGITATQLLTEVVYFMNGTLAWPSSPEVFSFNNGAFEAMADPFPSSLRTLNMHSHYFNCLPLLPDSLHALNYDHPGAYTKCLPNWPSTLEFALLSNQVFSSADAMICSVLNSECPGAYPGITGRVFIDSNSNGFYDTGEPGLPQANVTLDPNGNVVACATDGTWEIGVSPGTYTISAASNYPYIQSISPTQHTADVPNMGDTDTDNDFAATLTPDIQDLRAFVYADPARPGFDNQVHLRCENYGTVPVDAEVTLTFDTDQTWVGSSQAPATQTGNTATWNFSAMPIGSVQNIVVTLNTATSVVLGTDIAHTLVADPLATDETPADNSYTFTDSVVGSYDPNDKLLTPAVLSPTQVAQGETPVEYTIRFQNTGTYLAERVVIVDTLSEDLQWESMRFIASSHANHWYVTDGVLHVIHNDIMLPDSGSNEPGSHGFVKFSILPKSNLQDGASITNIAHIVFDFNEPIVTPPAIFTVDVEAAVSEPRNTRTPLLTPNPAHDRIQVRMPFAGTALYVITDILGRTRSTGLLRPDGWIDIESLTHGVYFLEVADGPQRVVERFVKN